MNGAFPNEESFARSPVRLEPSPLLHLCPSCGSDFVYPLEWHAAGPSEWEVWLRCPECEWRRGGVFPQAVVDRFDVELERAEAVLRDAHRQVFEQNMTDEVERFRRALAAGAVQPMDF